MSFDTQHRAFRLGDVINVVDYVANGSFAALKENVTYLDAPGYAMLMRTADFNSRWNGDYVWVDRKAFDFLGKSKLIQGDLILSNVGSVGVVFEVPNFSFPMTLGPNSVMLRSTSVDVHQKFLYYYFSSSTGQSLLKSISTGSVQAKFNKTDLRNSLIYLPNIYVQRSAVSVLSALDDRIALLRETNATLEAITQALFKSWFVDFDPVRAKMEGRAPEGMDEATAALFPDSFEETELGIVPRGWLPRSFRETIVIIGGGTPKTSNPDFWNGNIPWFSVVDAPVATDVFVIDTEKHITEAGLNGSSTKLLPAGTTIISARGTVGRLALTGCPMAMNQSCYGLRGTAGDDYFTFFSTTRLVRQLQQKAHGSVFDTITQETFSGVHLSYPNAEVITAFDSAVEPMMLRIRENLAQAQTLATLRDTLLPRLISGQLRLPEAQTPLEAALV